ncbi:MAG: LacI family transcriptional regulator [Microbacterium sp.]|nr:LacI family transcriptional regulator [Microbacterium sp.]
MARLKDVAARAEVSLSVASRVLNNDVEARINAQTRERVLAAAADLNYVPDHRARALRLSRAGAIALIVPEVNNAIFSSLHEGVQEVVHDRHSAVFLAQLEHGAPDARALGEIIGNGRVDGVILQRNEHLTDDGLRAAIALDVPVVLFNTRLEGHVGSVALDDQRAVSIAVGHLHTLGHRDVGFLAGPENHDAAARRLDGFRQATGESVREEWIVPGGWEAGAGADAMTTLLERPERPTAVVVASLNAAVGALRAAASLGVHVPDDLSLVAVQDAWIARFTVPTLTTVAMPMRQAGERAAMMLLEHLGGEPLTNELVSDPEPQLIVRQSSAAPGGSSSQERGDVGV